MADAYVRNGSEADTNHGGETRLIVKDGSDQFDRNAYIRFDLAAAPGPVRNATLTLSVERLPNGEPAPVNLFLSDDNSWQEYGITWNNRPPVNSAAPLCSAEVNKRGALEFDMTEFVNAAIERGDREITIVLIDGTTARRMVRFWSREGTVPPILALTFGEGAPAAAALHHCGGAMNLQSTPNLHSQALDRSAYAILKILEGGEQHGYSILEQLAGVAEHPPRFFGPVQLYRLLAKLLTYGLIEEAGDRPDDSLGAEQRRHYRLTEQGQRELSKALPQPATGAKRNAST